MSDSLADLREKLLSRSPEPVDYLSTGSTLLNLAISNRLDGGFPKGSCSLIVGDSDSGKTFLSLTCLAEAARDSRFDEYRFIYDNSERKAYYNVEHFFGKKLADRLEPPSWEGPERHFSRTNDELYYHLDDVLEAEKPFVYVIDSLDSLVAEEDEEKFQEQKEAFRKDKEISGSYGTAKAKSNSRGLQRSVSKIASSRSILIMVSQTRDNLGFGFRKKTRSGGNSPRFYATIEFWSSIKSTLKKTVRGKDRHLGILAELEIRKNHVTGNMMKIELPIYRRYGIDDLGSCVDYLLDEKYWSKSGSTVHAADFAFKGTREKLLEWIEKEGKEKEVQKLVATVWLDIESQCELRRRKRYE